MWREVVLYVVVSLLSFAASAAVTWGLPRRHYTSDHLIKTLLVSAADPATYAVLFGAKFAAYERRIPSPTRPASRGARRSRHQVPTTTRQSVAREEVAALLEQRN